MQVYIHFAKKPLAGVAPVPSIVRCTAAPFNVLKCFFAAAALAAAGALRCLLFSAAPTEKTAFYSAACAYFRGSVI